MEDYEVECLHCPERIDSRVSINETVQMMRKHVKEKHPKKEQF